MNEVWSGQVVEEANLNVQIARLRHVLDQYSKHGSCIQTFAGRGYCFVGAVNRTEAEAPAARPVTFPNAAPPRPRLSIVVLPFTHLAGDPEQQYFADGITDDLTTDLSRIAVRRSSGLPVRIGARVFLLYQKEGPRLAENRSRQPSPAARPALICLRSSVLSRSRLKSCSTLAD